jgi:hypothetical protein
MDNDVGWGLICAVVMCIAGLIALFINDARLDWRDRYCGQLLLHQPTAADSNAVYMAEPYCVPKIEVDDG